MFLLRLKPHTRTATTRLEENETQRRNVFVEQMKEAFPTIASKLYLCESPLEDPDRFIEIRERLKIDSFYGYLLSIVGYFNQNSSRFLSKDEIDDGLVRRGLNIDWNVVENDPDSEQFQDALEIHHYDDKNRFVFSSYIYMDFDGVYLDIHAPEDDDCVSIVFSEKGFDVKPVTIVE